VTGLALWEVMSFDKKSGFHNFTTSNAEPLNVNRESSGPVRPTWFAIRKQT